MPKRLSATVALLVGLPALFGMLAIVLISSDSSAGPGTPRVFSLPHFLERKGKTSNTNFTFDTTLFMTYLTGASSGGGTEATVELFLFKDNGDLLKSATNKNVCDPCEFTLNTTKRKLSIRIDTLITKEGGFPNNRELTGYGIIVVGGDTDGVSLQGFVVNSHTSPFDLSVFGFEPQPLTAVP